MSRHPKTEIRAALMLFELPKPRRTSTEHLTCVFPKCEAAGKCLGHTLSAPTPKGELLGVMMGAGFASTLITSYSLSWFNVESNGRTAPNIMGIDLDG